MFVVFLLSGCSTSPGGGSDAIDRYVQGMDQYRAGNQVQATASFNQAIQIDPKLRMPHQVLGEIYRKEGKYEDAAQQYQTAGELDPYSSSMAYYLGLCDQLLGKLAEASSAYLRSLDLEPKNAQANTNLGLVYLSMGKLQDANKYLSRATELDPKSAEAWCNAGVGLDAVGRLYDGESAYRRSLELNTDSVSTLENLAANLIAQHKGQEALAVCQQLLLRSDSAAARTRYGQALRLTGQPDAALEQFKLALELDPHSYLAMTQEGYLLIDEYRKSMELDEPKREAAMALWGASLRINPDQPRVVAAVEQWQSAQLYGK